MCPQVRALVISGVAAWVRELPAVFLSDMYLKYLGWALSDKDPAVRLAAVTGLLELYRRRPDSAPVLSTFRDRFSVRFRELTSDVDEAVAVKGCELLATLVGLGEMDKVDISGCYYLLADPAPSVRHAAAGLAVQLLEDSAATHTKAARDKAAATAAAAAATAAAGSPAATAAVGRKGACGKGGGGRKAPELSPQPPSAAAALQVPEAKLQRLGQLAALLDMLQVLHEGVGGGGGGEQAGAWEAALPAEDVADVVDALWERYPVLHDWAMLCEVLGDEAECKARGTTGSTHLAQVRGGARARGSGSSIVR